MIIMVMSCCYSCMTVLYCVWYYHDYNGDVVLLFLYGIVGLFLVLK